DTPIDLESQPGIPLHNVFLEPAPGINQTTIHSAIAQDSGNPSRAPFNYNGGFEAGSFLTTTVPAGVMSVTIRDPQLLVYWTDHGVLQPRAFQAGDYICLNDTSRVPDVNAAYVEDVQDGATEVRQLLAVDPSGRPGELRLYLDA